MVLRAKAEAREEIAQIKKSDLQSLRNQVIESQNGKFFWSLTQNPDFMSWIDRL